MHTIYDFAKELEDDHLTLLPNTSQKQSPKVTIPPKTNDTEADLSPMAKARAKPVENTIGSKKKRKDPNAPKKPRSSFMYFSNAKRAEVKVANPDASFGEIVSKAIAR